MRTVGKDNTVSFEGVRLQIDKQSGRRTCAGLAVQVRRHLHGGYTIRRGTQVLGRYDADGRLRPAVAIQPTHQDAAGATQRTRVDCGLVPAISTYPPSGSTRHARVPACGRSGSLRPALLPLGQLRNPSESGQITCQNRADRSLVINSGGRHPGVPRPRVVDILEYGAHRPFLAPRAPRRRRARCVRRGPSRRRADERLRDAVRPDGRGLARHHPVDARVLRR